jgi:sporulation protein YlmC with PRC-barrel domain
MKQQGEILIVHRLLDEQILDCDGKRCGRVDDIELQGSPPRITALLVGEALYPRRVPERLRRWARKLAGPERWGANALRVPWEKVDEIEATLRLSCKAEELGLGEGDDPERWMVRRLPWN